MPAGNGEGVFSGVGVAGREVGSTVGGEGSGLVVGVGSGSWALASGGASGRDGRTALGEGSIDGLAKLQAASKKTPSVKR